MSWQMWFLIIVGTPSALLFLVALASRLLGGSTSDENLVTIIGSFGVVVLALVVFALGAFTVVGTRQVGIETVFGRPTGKTYHNGLHAKAPWANVAEFDGAVQINKFDSDGNRIKVRLQNNSTAEADSSIRWQIKQNAADGLFVQYKTFDNVRENLVERNFKVALNEQFQTFDPLSSERDDNGSVKSVNDVSLQKFADGATKYMREQVGDQIEILDVTVSRLVFSEDIEKKIDQLNAERAATAVAEQSEQTAIARRKANETLSTSVSNDPNVIVSNCIDKALDKNISPWGCWPGQGAVPTVGVPGR